MIKLTIGTIFVLLFLYCLSIVLRMSRISSKQKELEDVIIDEKVAELDDEIEARREKLRQKDIEIAPDQKTANDRYGH